VGNRLKRVDSVEETTTYVYDDNDRLLDSTENGVVTAYLYDNNGNLTSETTNGKTTAYTWDDRNRLVEVNTADGDTVVYEYDDENIRVSSTVNGAKTTYLVDSNRPYAQVLEEYEDDNLKVRYVHGLDLISVERDGEVSVYLVDGLGSTRVLTDLNGEVVATYTYDAFGELLDSTGDVENDYLFAGEPFDGELEQYYLRQRFYDAETGRFTRRDTYEGRIGEPITLHKYLYGNANPVYFVDPSGLTALSLRFTASLELQSFISSALAVTEAAFLSYAITQIIPQAILAIQGAQIRGNTEKIAVHLAKLDAAPVAGCPPPTDYDVTTQGIETQAHWLEEIINFAKNVNDAARLHGGKIASRKQIVRELNKRFTDSQIEEIEEGYNNIISCLDGIDPFTDIIHKFDDLFGGPPPFIPGG